MLVISGEMRKPGLESGEALLQPRSQMSEVPPGALMPAIRNSDFKLSVWDQDTPGLTEKAEIIG